MSETNHRTALKARLALTQVAHITFGGHIEKLSLEKRCNLTM
jgi:hypothetical protein